MARKVSKHSRAARRGADELPESKQLEEVPRAQRTDLANILTRTAAKNEALLEARLQRKKKHRVGKKGLRSKLSETSVGSEKGRFQRALDVASRLDGKIARSISRAKYVQTARKSGWDSINEQIRKETVLTSGESKDMKDVKDQEDAMIDDEEEVTAPENGNQASNLFGVLTDDVEV